MAISRSDRRTERAALFETPAGFDDPLEMLLGCHRRIERQLETLKRLRGHIAVHGVDAEASSAAQAILKYFHGAAPNHHLDEEKDVFPLLERRITDPGESARFRAFREQLEMDHRELGSAWSRLRKPLEAIGEGLMRTLPEDDVHAFVSGYAHHIVTEESALQEFFNRWLDDADREALGRAMANRRSVVPPKA
jgi:hemerythrin-like domain-containing protein